jgi:TM2 domain-containing membrane protein YozV
VTRQAPAPIMRPGISLGAGYTTFRAPAFGPEQAASQADRAPGEPSSEAQQPPPPPPPIAGTGVAPPPQVGVQVSPQQGWANVQGQHAAGSVTRYYPAPKTRVIFVLLGIFLGIFGVHNFYAGYVKKGTIQLCVTLLTCFYGAIASWIWAIVEICTVGKDAEGTQFV